MQKPTPTLARRYGFKLLANMASVPVYLVMEAILPRALGPQMYGNYSFATNLFQQLSGFLDMAPPPVFTMPCRAAGTRRPWPASTCA